MKKIFSILMAVLFVGVLFATPSTSTLTFTAACGGTGTADDDAVWTVTSDGEESTYDSSKGIHYGTGSKAVGYIQLSTSDIAGTITSVVVNASAASGVSASVSVTVGEDAFTCESETSAAVSASATDYTFEGSASGEIVVRLAKAASANKALYVKSVVVTYEGGSEPTTQDLYLTLSSDWAGWTEKFSVYYFKDENDNGWSGFMTAVVGEENMYTTTIPAGYSKVIFVRNNSAATAPGWDSGDYSIVWSKTVDLTIPEGKNHFTVTSGGTGSECNGTWSKHGEPVIPAKFYITGDSALVTDAGAPGNAWNPAAIKSETDTFTLENLKADQYYILKLTLDGTWVGENNVKGYNELTEKTAGLDDVSDDHNIGFKLNEAGDVKVVYIADETPVFKLIGDFYVAPVVEPAKYYITGDSALVTDAGAPGKAWNPDAIKSETDTFTLKNLKADQYYILKLTLNGTWVGENNVKGYNELTEKTAGLDDVSDDHNIGFKLNEAGDVQVIYKDGETPVFKLVGNFVVEIPHYFIAGTMTNWKDEMVELLALEEKTDSLGVALNLKADSLYLYKIVRVQGTDTAWYGLDGDATMEYGNSTGWYIYKSEGDKNQKNVGLQTTKEGDYPVTLVIKEDQLIVSVVIPKPDTKYYAKYADKAGEWNWKLLTEKEGKWLTDTIVYYGGGMNIHSAAEGDGKYFAEIAGVAAKDTAYFSFNPEDSTLVATVVGKYIKPFPVMQIAGQWDMEGENWIVNNMVLAADSLTATYEVSLEKGDYEFKLIKDGKWITKANGGEPYGLHRTWPGVAGVIDEATENLKLTADADGKYLFTWTFANDSIGITFPDKPEPKLADGYYLVGKFSGVDAWSVDDLSAAKLFAVNPENDKEYQLNITLAVEDSLKVVYVAEDVITTWFPAEGDNYGVDANHAGATTIYFRPDYQGGEGWFAGCLYVVPTSTVDIEITNDGVQAIKVLRNGQILIIKGEKTYNAQGQLVR
ncbi:MAG: hypothetical protein IJV61_05150 [Paludibacteraceae bacterium]|nr:hypothetical protein [Paludibacteraceae bacterium]